MSKVRTGLEIRNGKIQRAFSCWCFSCKLYTTDGHNFRIVKLIIAANLSYQYYHRDPRGTLTVVTQVTQKITYRRRMIMEKKKVFALTWSGVWGLPLVTMLKHFGQGINRVTKNRPSDVWTNLVPSVGYQSSSNMSIWSTHIDRICVKCWILISYFVVLPLFPLLSTALTHNTFIGKNISIKHDLLIAIVDQLSSCFNAKLMFGRRYIECSHCIDTSCSRNIKLSCRYSAIPHCHSCHFMSLIL